MLQKIFSKFIKKTPMVEIQGQQESLLKCSGENVKRVFWLTDQLDENPKQIELTRLLTLNANKPNIGLRGVHGLFASPEWWGNINNQNMPLKFISGTVVRAYEAGQDHEGKNNTVDLLQHDGTVTSVGIYTNNKKDVALFKPGATVEIVYALDELKSQPASDGGVSYSKVALEMVVSMSPEKQA